MAGFAIRETMEAFGAPELRVGVAVRLRQQGVIAPCRWSVAGKEVASVGLQRIDFFLLEVSYVRRDRAGFSPVECVVQLTTTRCNLGGERFWFYCPNCNRRTGSIFIVGPPFQCRVCLRLRYQSQRESHGMRLLAKAIRLRKRFGGTRDAWSFRSKPKGMHRRTYKRLIAKLGDLTCQFYGCLAVQFRLPGFEHPDELEEHDIGYRKKRAYHRRNACSE